VVQCYLWFIQDASDSSNVEWNAVNTSNVIMGNTHTTNGTKYDPSDDSQASVFFFNEPMTPGVLLIWGDHGWNLFYQGPYGESDINFIRGDFADHVIKMTSEPIYTVRPKYKGCNDACDYWMEYIYGPMPDGLGMNLVDWNGNTLSESKAVEYCEETAANSYWDCVISCAKKAEEEVSCSASDTCIDACEWNDADYNYCRENKSINLKVHVEVPSRYLSKSSHRNRLLNKDGSLKVGAFVRGYGAVPGSFVDFNPNKLDYTVPLANGDVLPNSMFSANDALAEAQVQAMPAIFQRLGDSWTMWGTSYNEPNSMYTGNWYWLVIYGYHWFYPTLEGWSLYSVEPPYLMDPYDFRDKRVTVRYGDLRAVEGGILP